MTLSMKEYEKITHVFYCNGILIILVYRKFNAITWYHAVTSEK